MNKKIVFILLLVCCLFVGGCSVKKDGSASLDDGSKHVTLKINMPLNFDDLDSYFELPLLEVLESDNIGSIDGDGTPIGDYGPYLTDIEFNINKDKFDEFRKLIDKYEYPMGSYLEIDGEEALELTNSDKITGVRLEFDNLDSDDVDMIYSELSNLNVTYKYKTLIDYLGNSFAYYYSENISDLEKEFNKYISDKNYNDKIKIISMPQVIVELNQ